MKNYRIQILKWVCYAVAVGTLVSTVLIGQLYTPEQAIENAVRDGLNNNSVQVSTDLANNSINIHESANITKKLGILKWSDFTNNLPIFEKGILHTIQTKDELSSALIVEGAKDKEYYQNYIQNLRANGWLETSVNHFTKDKNFLVITESGNDIKLDFNKS